MSSVAPAEPRISRYHQIAPRRKIAAALLTEAGWISGEITIPKLNSLVEYLNSTEGFLKLTNVSIPGVAPRLDFLALSQDAYSVIIPKADDRLRSAKLVPQDRKHGISCIFTSGWVSGTLETNASIRVSDFLTPAKPYFLLTDCRLALRGTTSRTPLVIINGRRVIGISNPSVEESSKAV